MKRSVCLPVLVATSCVLAGCGPLQGLFAKTAETAIKNLPIDGKLKNGLSKLAGGQLLPPPRIDNALLAPIFVKALAGQVPSLDDIAKVLLLTNGLETGSLPANPGQKQLTIKVKQYRQIFGLLGDGTFRLAAGSAETAVGTGGASPSRESQWVRKNPAIMDNAPLFAARPEARYRVLAGSSVDLRPQMPPIRDQGPRGTCVMFATTGMMDFMNGSKASMPIKRCSPQFLNWLYNIEVKSKVPDDQPYLWQDAGTVCSQFYPVLRLEGNREVSDESPYIPPQQGYLSEEEVPYQPDQVDESPSADSAAISRKHLGTEVATKIAARGIFTSQGAYFFRIKSDAASYEAALTGGQPIQLGYPIYDTDWDEPAAPGYQIPEMTKAKAADESKIGYHSVIIVGYERDGGAPGGGWFIVRNSWGDDWGENGYCRVSYKTTFDYAHSGHIATTYGKPFNARYGLTPPPQSAPAVEEVIPDQPLPKPEEVGDKGGYTTADQKDGLSLDGLIDNLIKATGIKLPF